MKTAAIMTLGIVAALAIIFAMSYGLAHIGEPRAVWLMDLIGVGIGQ